MSVSQVILGGLSGLSVVILVTAVLVLGTPAAVLMAATVLVVGVSVL